MTQCITITFGEQVENHVGMQKIGKLAEKGFSFQELNDAKILFEQKGYICELITLKCPIKEYKEHGYLLIIRGGINCLSTDKLLFDKLV